MSDHGKDVVNVGYDLCCSSRMDRPALACRGGRECRYAMVEHGRTPKARITQLKIEYMSSSNLDHSVPFLIYEFAFENYGRGIYGGSMISTRPLHWRPISSQLKGESVRNRGQKA